jgi:hypothetical protein
MYRAQVLIEEWQYERLRALSELQGRSISGLLREILTRELDGKKKAGGLAAIEGIVSSPGLLGAQHDEVLYGKRRR